MKSRDKILQKLRAAAPAEKMESAPLQPDTAYFQDTLDEPRPALINQFAARLRALHGEFFEAADESEAADILLDLFDSLDGGACVVQQHDSIAAVLARNEKLAVRCEVLAETLDGHRFAEFPAGLSVADFLVARTGSVVLRNVSAGGRRLSVLPPVHIVLAWQNQLVPSLDAALQSEQLARTEWSHATIITGPSRTADIQKNLVLGAHGPKRLIVILIRKTN